MLAAAPAIPASSSLNNYEVCLNVESHLTRTMCSHTIAKAAQPQKDCFEVYALAPGLLPEELLQPFMLPRFACFCLSDVYGSAGWLIRNFAALVHTKINRVGQGNCRAKGFRVNQQRRFSVYRLQKRFVYLIRRFLNRWNWKSSCGEALRLLRRCSRRRNNSSSNNPEMAESISRRNINRYDYKLRSYRRSNSFYAEAIADCLEFIKRSSRSTDGNSMSRSPGDRRNRFTS